MKNNDRIFVVHDEPDNRRCPWASGDEFLDFYATADEANGAAESAWNHLTAREQKRRHIYVDMILKNDLDENCFDEETGEPQWSAYCGDNHYIPGAFDSYNLPGNDDPDCYY